MGRAVVIPEDEVRVGPEDVLLGHFHIPDVQLFAALAPIGRSAVAGGSPEHVELGVETNPVETPHGGPFHQRLGPVPDHLGIVEVRGPAGPDEVPLLPLVIVVVVPAFQGPDVEAHVHAAELSPAVVAGPVGVLVEQLHARPASGDPLAVGEHLDAALLVARDARRELGPGIFVAALARPPAVPLGCQVAEVVRGPGEDVGVVGIVAVPEDPDLDHVAANPEELTGYPRITLQPHLHLVAEPHTVQREAEFDCGLAPGGNYDPAAPQVDQVVDAPDQLAAHAHFPFRVVPVLDLADEMCFLSGQVVDLLASDREEADGLVHGAVPGRSRGVVTPPQFGTPRESRGVSPRRKPSHPGSRTESLRPRERP